MLKFARFAIVALFAVTLIAGCGGGAPKSDTPTPVSAAKPVDAPKPAEPAAVTPAPAAVPAATAVVVTPPMETKPTDAAPVSTPAAPGVALDAKTIVGTKWNAAGYTLGFQDAGVVKINEDMEGTYKIEGNKVTIDAGGSSYEATIEGDKLMYEGSPLEKL